MFNKKEELLEIIDKQINELNNNIRRQHEKNNDLVELYNELKNDINRIIYVKDEDLKKIINKFEIEDKDKLYDEIETIKKILTMNKDYKSTLRLFKKNTKQFELFLDYFNILNEKLKVNDPEIDRINARIDKYNSLKNDIKEDNYKLKSKDIDLLEDIFTSNNDIESQKVLLELINFENKRFKDTVKKSKKKTSKKLTDTELEELFKLYDYNYKKLDDIYKDYLKKNNIDNISKIFNALKNNDYPHIDNDYVLISILLGSSEETINKVTSFAKENKLIPKSLLDISGALITQNNNDSSDEYSIMTKGSSIDFTKNIMTLKTAGISINYIFQSCKSILTMPNDLLEKNLDLFNKYGFSFDYKRRGVIDPSPCALMTNTFAEVTDAFIEVHKDGLKYLTDNLSNLKTVTNPNALMFYNIYESEKNYKGNIDDPEDGPFRKVMEEDKENLQLKAIITRNRPDYRDSYYKDIKEDNKYEKTHTIEIPIRNKDKYNEIINNNKDIEISNSIFNNSYIESIDKYIDEDSALIYNFNGTRISRLKVLRIYNILLKNGIKDSIDSFMYAITYNTIISKDNYDNLYRCVKKEIEAR